MASIQTTVLVDGLFLDTEKSFDTVNHGTLLCKLYHCGVRGLAFRWFESYLSDKYQRFRIYSVMSEKV